ncbi:MAG: DUF485 domain-containing protein [Hydrogenobacter sp.]|uniref:DUF485 domain-containing protein n=1 Tax=Hydrogenobacter thermophilus TaxID=940 RepID=UPI0030FA7B8C
MKEVLESKEFKELASRRNTVATLLTVLQLLMYFGFIFVLAFKKDILSQKVSEGLTVGIPVGIAIIVISWLLTGIYVYWANTYYDRAVEEIKNKFRR